MVAAAVGRRARGARRRGWRTRLRPRAVRLPPSRPPGGTDVGEARRHSRRVHAAARRRLRHLDGQSAAGTAPVQQPAAPARRRSAHRNRPARHRRPRRRHQRRRVGAVPADAVRDRDQGRRRPPDAGRADRGARRPGGRPVVGARVHVRRPHRDAAGHQRPRPGRAHTPGHRDVLDRRRGPAHQPADRRGRRDPAPRRRPEPAHQRPHLRRTGLLRHRSGTAQAQPVGRHPVRRPPRLQAARCSRGGRHAAGAERIALPAGRAPGPRRLRVRRHRRRFGGPPVHTLAHDLRLRTAHGGADDRVRVDRRHHRLQRLHHPRPRRVRRLRRLRRRTRRQLLGHARHPGHGRRRCRRHAHGTGGGMAGVAPPRALSRADNAGHRAAGVQLRVPEHGVRRGHQRAQRQPPQCLRLGARRPVLLLLLRAGVAGGRAGVGSQGAQRPPGAGAARHAGLRDGRFFRRYRDPSVQAVRVRHQCVHRRPRRCAPDRRASKPRPPRRAASTCPGSRSYRERTRAAPR